MYSLIPMEGYVQGGYVQGACSLIPMLSLDQQDRELENMGIRLHHMGIGWVMYEVHVALSPCSPSISHQGACKLITMYIALSPMLSLCHQQCIYYASAKGTCMLQ